MAGEGTDPIPAPQDLQGHPIFGKSLSNVVSEGNALALLLSDPRFQQPPVGVKKGILDVLAPTGAWSHRTFDAVMLPEPEPPISPKTLPGLIDRLALIEMKATRKPIRNAALNGFFFGATQREFDLAEALGDRYLFAFVVLSSDNDYGRPFFVLMGLEELDLRTRTKRIQYQVNFRTDIAESGSQPYFGPHLGTSDQDETPLPGS